MNIGRSASSCVRSHVDLSSGGLCEKGVELLKGRLSSSNFVESWHALERILDTSCKSRIMYNNYHQQTSSKSLIELLNRCILMSGVLHAPAATIFVTCKSEIDRASPYIHQNSAQWIKKRGGWLCVASKRPYIAEIILQQNVSTWGQRESSALYLHFDLLYLTILGSHMATPIFIYIQ